MMTTRRTLVTSLGALPEPARFQAEGKGSMPLAQPPHHDTQVQVRKPMGTMNH